MTLIRVGHNPKKNYYTQCRLQKTIDEKSYAEQVSYIPSELAVVGRTVRLKEEDGTWEDGWKVMHAGESVSKEDAPDYRKAIRNHRKSTGDSLKA